MVISLYKLSVQQGIDKMCAATGDALPTKGGPYAFSGLCKHKPAQPFQEKSNRNQGNVGNNQKFFLIFKNISHIFRNIH